MTLELSGSGRVRLAAEVRRCWSRCLAVDGRGLGVSTLRLVLDDDPDVVAATRGRVNFASTSILELLDRLSPLVTVAAIDAQAGQHLMMHAAGVATSAGGTIALVAPSGTGKTTATGVLGRSLGYVSDETVAVRADGTIAAYPKPLSVIVPETPGIKIQVSPDDLAMGTPPTGCHLAAVAILERANGATLEVEAVGTVEALARLAPETSYFGALTRPLHHLAGILHRTGGLRVIRYAEATQLREIVATLLEPS